jgi:hypothetical protein
VGLPRKAKQQLAMHPFGPGLVHPAATAIPATRRQWPRPWLDLGFFADSSIETGRYRSLFQKNNSKV